MSKKPRDGKQALEVVSDRPGRLGVDDRGNVTWEWRDDDELLADDDLGTMQRMHALVDPRLEIKDDEDDPLKPARSNPKGLKQGYNPYNSGALGKQRWRKKKNLRELSKWIELRKKLTGRKTPDGG